MKLQVQQQVEVKRLKRSFCQAMLEKVLQFSPLLTRQFFEELVPIIPHLVEAVIPPMSSYLEFRDLSLSVATIVSFYDFNFLKKREPLSGGLISADVMVPISKPRNRVKVLHHIRAAYGEEKIDYLQGIGQQVDWTEVDSLIDLGTVYLVENKYESAKNWYNKALQVLLEQPDLDQRKIALLWNKLGLLDYLGNVYEDAELACQKSLNIQCQYLNATDLDIAETLNNLGVLYCSQKNFSKAKYFLNEALEIHRISTYLTQTQIRLCTMATQKSFNNMQRDMEFNSTYREEKCRHQKITIGKNEE